jgi:hypothetical protein
VKAQEGSVVEDQWVLKKNLLHQDERNHQHYPTENLALLRPIHPPQKAASVALTAWKSTIKRKTEDAMFSSSVSTTETNNDKDPVIGLDVSGKVFYFRLALLLKSGGKFFKTLVKEGNEAYKDERGRKVFFLDRCPDTFKYVAKFLVSGQLNLPEDDMAIRRDLRDEAKFLGLIGLTKLLTVCHTFSPAESNQGVLYWLGTKKGKAPYENPYSLGAVYVGGWVDDPKNEEEDIYELAKTARSREAFVHYRLKPHVHFVKNTWEMESFNCLLWCEQADRKLPVMVDLKSVLLRPTHYSLRVSHCSGMAGDWNFEASKDGKTWDVLHEARSDRSLHLPEGPEEQLEKRLQFYSDHVRSDQLAADLILSTLEQDHRHTWTLKPPPTQFYRCFRIIGAGASPEDGDCCLHGEGLELYGDVYEV